jgi:hypothetical protein
MKIGVQKEYHTKSKYFVTTIKTNKMDLLNINSPKFLGGQNVHNVIIIGLLAFAAYKLK